MNTSLLIRKATKPIFNIGDYVQSIAAAQFLDCNNSKFVERESLNQYDGEDTKVIMNGWFMHTNNWPPSDHIHPLFVSFHINTSAKQTLLSPQSIEYFKQHEPIGCRDENTCSMLKAKGVDAYFSGCLTLTLGRSYHNDGTGKDIYIVDPIIRPKLSVMSIISYLGTFITKLPKIYKIYKKAENHKIMSFSRCVVFFSQYSKICTEELLLNAKYPTVYVKNDFDSVEARINYAKSCLENYSKAKLVITSRIHCHMPCLAMCTPTVFLNDVNDHKSSSCRLGGLMDFYTIVNYNFGDFSSDDVNFNNKLSVETEVKNKGRHYEIAEQLAQTCLKFTGYKREE